MTPTPPDPVPAPDRRRRLLVVDPDPDTLRAFDAALRAAGYAHVTLTSDAARAAAMVGDGRFDLVVAAHDAPGSPGDDGFGLLRSAHACDARLPVVVTSEDGTAATAVEALRLRAADFLLKPVDPGELVRRVDAVLAQRVARRGREVVLAIGAHPDDVEIGAGATLLAHRARGDRVAILIMSVGERGGMAAERGREAAAAADLLGAELVLGSLEDTRIPDQGRAVELVEEAVTWVGPTRVYTHSANDRHQDHHNTHRAVTVGTRRVPRVYAFQSPSCTVDYRPTRFEAIDATLEGKLALLACHQSQSASRDYLEPDVIVATARYWGRFGPSRYVEPYEVLRDVQGSTVPASGGVLLPEGLAERGQEARDLHRAG